MTTQYDGPTLVVEGLKTQFFTRAGVAKAVDDVSFTVKRGEIMGLVGESGSGKSMTGYSIMGLIDSPGKVVDGKILLKGQDLRGLPQDAMRKIRGSRIAMIFQDPMMTLNPVLRIDTQMMEAVFAHQDVSRERAREMARDALARVGIPSPDERLRAYPHQFSGGMRQRVAIAIALLNKPDLIICDEPTTALDVTIQGQILYEMQKLCRESGTALIWITHDLSVVAGLADSVCVMYAGKIVESGTVRQVLEHPRHPYTYGLIGSAPSRNVHGQPLRQIPGMTPSLLHLPTGCAFRTRCDRATEVCTAYPELRQVDGRALRCFHPVREVLEAVQ
ncbi:MAG TPA: ABC transporter ATP-binding protein [Noviherbaspirillum sp.]|nr:ABC transporter ATP-binding protein [Noviherbaspirillum sp.]